MSESTEAAEGRSAAQGPEPPTHKPSSGPGQPQGGQPDDGGLRRRRRNWLGIGLAAAAAAVALSWWCWQNWDWLWPWAQHMWDVLRDRELFRQRIESYGPWAPLAFTAVQFAQVLLSPIPGEITGAAGGYIFGWWWGFFYSTVGLSLASWFNFFLARLLGKRFIERLLPPQLMARFSYLMERQGVIASFMAFIFPGFPKDYFCFFLGLTPINWKVFMVISAVGRMPATLMLSIMGHMVYQESYWTSGVLFVISLMFLAPVWLWRERIYGWLYRLEKGRGPLGEDE